jgi:hypothetical protein
VSLDRTAPTSLRHAVPQRGAAPDAPPADGFAALLDAADRTPRTRTSGSDERRTGGRRPGDDAAPTRERREHAVRGQARQAPAENPAAPDVLVTPAEPAPAPATVAEAPAAPIAAPLPTVLPVAAPAAPAVAVVPADATAPAPTAPAPTTPAPATSPVAAAPAMAPAPATPVPAPAAVAPAAPDPRTDAPPLPVPAVAAAPAAPRPTPAPPATPAAAAAAAVDAAPSTLPDVPEAPAAAPTAAAAPAPAVAAPADSAAPHTDAPTLPDAPVQPDQAGSDAQPNGGGNPGEQPAREQPARPDAPAAAAPVAPSATSATPPVAQAPAPPARHAAAPLHQAPRAVAELLHLAVDRGITHAKLNLRPADLGGIEIRLQTSSAGVTAQVVADSPEAAKLLQQAADDLRRSLERSNVTLLSLDIGTAGQDRFDGSAGASADFAGEQARHHGAHASVPAAAPAEEQPAVGATVHLPSGLLVDVLA